MLHDPTAKCSLRIGYQALLKWHLIIAILAVLPPSANLSASESPANPALKQPPNVLMVITDDQGWGDLSGHDNAHLKTPRLDQLRLEGARLSRFFVSPVCAPTRAGLLTGRYHLRTGTHGVTRGRETMSSDEQTLAEFFGLAGYRTGCFGKWHNGAHYPESPRGQGFDEFLGFCAGHWNNYFNTQLEHNDRSITTKGYIADVLTDGAIDFIRTSNEQPFFCYVSLNTPHSPWQVPESYWSGIPAADELDDKARCAYAMCENIDSNIGRLLDCLKDEGLESKTIVVFLTDNGPNSNRFNGDMRGLKGSVHEGGSRVPCFIRYPGVIEPRTEVTAVTANIDMLPTLASLSGVKQPLPANLDGRNLTPLLTSPERVRWSDRELFCFRGKGERGAVRTERWRAVMERPGVWQLYDMQDDPSQTRNVADDFPEVLTKLSSHYVEFLAEVHANELEPLPIQVGHELSPKVTLPGHEAFCETPQGERQGLHYSGRNGWANDWLSQWTDPAAYAFWNIEVVNPGVYQIIAQYSLSGETPARLQIAASQNQLVSSIKHQARSPEIPSPDRIPRIEVMEREWAEVDLGRIKLEQGNQQLQLHHTTASIECQLEIKSLRLVRVDD